MPCTQNFYRIACLLNCLLFVAGICPSTSSGAEIIFADDFESGELAEQWDQVNIPSAFSGGLETALQHVHSGKRSLRLTALENEGNSSVAQVVRWFLPGYDRLYFRYYAKFAENFNQGNFMHWTMIGGSRTDEKYSGFGKAGIKPDGTDFFTAMFEPARHGKEYSPPGALQFSVSYPEMEVSQDGEYWTNSIHPRQPVVMERGRWYCLETMVKLNEVGRTDGEMAFWVDGEKQLHIRDFHWRDSEVLKLNYFWFSVYIHQARQDNTCWYDDLVISTEYVGPE
ncbi:polysaccharide lyase [Gemmatimonadota bacterium]